jgi:cell wall-associated NlpC family hydrolase
VFFLGTPRDVSTFVGLAQPGDVILFRTTHTTSDNAISRYQGLYSPQHYSQAACECTHAALYIRDTTIMHAVPGTKQGPGGVKYDDLAVYGLRCEVSLLRALSLPQGAEQNILLKADLRRGESYDHLGVWRAVWQSVLNKMQFRMPGDPRYRTFYTDSPHYKRMSCSGFVRRVYLDALGAQNNPFMRGRAPAPLYTPADIHENAWMKSIRVP